MKSKIILKIVVPFLVLIMICKANSFLYAQEFPPSGPPATSGAPIDGGVSILIAAGVAYGIKKLNKKQKSNN